MFLPNALSSPPCSWGLILYRTRLPAAALHAGGTLDLGAPVHDYASVLVDGRLAGRLDRSQLGGSRLQVAPHQPGKGSPWQRSAQGHVHSLARMCKACCWHELKPAGWF